MSLCIDPLRNFLTKTRRNFSTLLKPEFVDRSDIRVKCGENVVRLFRPWQGVCVAITIVCAFE